MSDAANARVVALRTATLRASRLISWYDRHARPLPWRISPRDGLTGVRQDPYKVWLSEIMLQQTTVAAVIPYFEKFIARWPTVGDLASASDDDVRAAWAGLGYYRRAANLHACAKVIANGTSVAGGTPVAGETSVSDERGKFPSTAQALKDLPGIGDYTSAAIASIAFGQAVPVVDGNVERVVTRLFALDTPLPKVKADVTAKVAAMVPDARPGDFAQAMMDLGATICTPKNPACALCPWMEGCTARAQGNMTDYPVKAPKKAKPHRTGAALVVVRGDGAVWCERRPDTGLLPGMTQVPTTPWQVDEPPTYEDAEKVGQIAHIFTHFSLYLDVYRRNSEQPPARDGAQQGWWSVPQRIAQEAWPTVMVKVLKCAVPDLGLRVSPSAKKAQAKSKP